MIKLTKGDTPAILHQKAHEWTQVILDKLTSGQPLTKSDKGHYSNTQIKDALIKETSGKCAYCESKIRHIDYADIEHIVPKSVFPERWFEWSNLTIACSICNGSKSDFVGDHDSFIDPYLVDPEDHFWIAGPTILPKPGCDAAKITEVLLKLNRAELVERRGERLRGLMSLLDTIERTKSHTLKVILQADFLLETNSDTQYTALAREVARGARERAILP